MLKEMSMDEMMMVDGGSTTHNVVRVTRHGGGGGSFGTSKTSGHSGGDPDARDNSATDCGGKIDGPSRSPGGSPYAW